MACSGIALAFYRGVSVGNSNDLYSQGALAILTKNFNNFHRHTGIVISNRLWVCLLVLQCHPIISLHVLVHVNRVSLCLLTVAICQMIYECVSLEE
jgi:hypothetical protein